MPFVRLFLEGTRVVAVSDDQGRYQLRVKAGTYRLVAQRIGYAPAAVALVVTDATDTVPVLRMRPLAQRLDGVVQTVSSIHPALARDGFYSRITDANKGLLDGTFITPEELEARRPLKPSQILQGIRGVRIEFNRTQRGGEFAFPLSSRSGCLMSVYVDGARFTIGDGDKLGAGTSRMTGAILEGPGIDLSVPMSQIAAIEVYPTATQAPAQFQITNNCGIILFWTRK